MHHGTLRRETTFSYFVVSFLPFYSVVPGVVFTFLFQHFCFHRTLYIRFDPSPLWVTDCLDMKAPRMGAFFSRLGNGGGEGKLEREVRLMMREVYRILGDDANMRKPGAFFVHWGWAASYGPHGPRWL